MDHNENTDFVGNVDATATVAITASTPLTSDNSDIISVADKTESVNSDVAPVAASITSGTPTVSDDSNIIIISATTAGTPTISDHRDNTATVGMDVAPVAGVITISNDSNNTVTVSSDMSVAGATTAGTPTISDHSDNTATHPPSLMTATTPWQQWLSTVVGATTAGTPTVSNHSDNIATVGRDVAPVACWHTYRLWWQRQHRGSQQWCGPAAPWTTAISNDSGNTVSFGSDAGSQGFSAAAAVITTSTPILTDDSNNVISVSGDAVIAAAWVLKVLSPSGCHSCRPTQHLRWQQQYHLCRWWCCYSCWFQGFSAQAACIAADTQPLQWQWQHSYWKR